MPENEYENASEDVEHERRIDNNSLSFDLYSSDDEEDITKAFSSGTEKKCLTIYELLNKEYFHRSINTKIIKSPAEVLLMSLELAVNDKFSLNTVSKVNTLINTICEKEVIAEIRYPT